MSDPSPLDAGLFDDLQRQAQRLRDLERELAHSRLLLSSVPEAAKLRFATLIDGRSAPHFTWREVALDSPYWGSSSIGMQPYFTPGVSRLDILRRDGKVLTGRILLPAQARGGHWTVLSMALFFEPRSARWFIEHLSISNAANVDLPPVY